MVALAAAPLEWILAWPELPKPESLLYIFLDPEGRPTLDGPESPPGDLPPGVPKRTRGRQTGTIVVLGDPRPQEAPGLALASRGLDTAAQVVGTSGLKSLPYHCQSWLSAWERVTVWADNDDAGRQSARAMRVALGRTSRAPPLTVRLLRQERADPADAAAIFPLPRLDLELVRRTAERNVDDLNLPLWEAARRAALITT